MPIIAPIIAGLKAMSTAKKVVVAVKAARTVHKIAKKKRVKRR